MKKEGLVICCSRLILVWFTLIVAIILSSCEKQNDNNEDVITPHERQLHSFAQGTVGFYYNPPTVVNNFIYIGTSRGTRYQPANDNAFFKLDANLNKMWEFPLSIKEVRGAATLDQLGNIYFVVGERPSAMQTSTLELYSLDNDGNFRWSKNISGYAVSAGMLNPAISVDSIIYVGGDDFYAFDINGNEVWRYTISNISQPVMNAPIIDPLGNIYFLYLNKVISLDRNGVERWQYNSPENCEALSSPAFSADYSKIYCPLYKSVYCLETINGNLEWVFNDPGMIGDFRATPAVDDNNIVYIGSHGIIGDLSQSLYAIKANGSGFLWKTTFGSDLYSSPAIDNNRVLYVGSEGYETTSSPNNRLHAIDMANGQIIWTAQLEMCVTFSSPAISNNGTLYIASMDYYAENRKGMVYSFRTNSSGLLPNAGSPRFHEGNASTGRRE